MARCPDCNKFVSYDEQEPDVNIDVVPNADHTSLVISGTVTVTLPCAECGTELKTYEFEVEKEVDVEGLTDESSIDFNDDASFTSRSEGKGRGTRTFYGYELNIDITVDEKSLDTVHLSDDAQASSFEECY